MLLLQARRLRGGYTCDVDVDGGNHGRANYARSGYGCRRIIKLVMVVTILLHYQRVCERARLVRAACLWFCSFALKPLFPSLFHQRREIDNFLQMWLSWWTRRRGASGEVCQHEFQRQ